MCAGAVLIDVLLLPCSRSISLPLRVTPTNVRCDRTSVKTAPAAFCSRSGPVIMYHKVPAVREFSQLGFLPMFGRNHCGAAGASEVSEVSEAAFIAVSSVVCRRFGLSDTSDTGLGVPGRTYLPRARHSISPSLARLHQLDAIFTIFGASDRDKRLILQGRGLRKRL
jgi:hypothetical protein